MTRPALSCLVLLLAACDGGAAKPAGPPAEPAEKVAVAPPTRAEPEAPPTPKYPQGEADEACTKIVVVAWQGAEDAEATITRDKAAAQARAGELQKKLSSGTAFAELAAESDEPKTKAKGGAMGTYARDNWPDKYAPLKDVVFALGIGETSAAVEHPHGFVVAQRCKVEKVHTRHILVRYAGARNAEAKLKRTKEQAQKLATEIHVAASEPGADFEALAKKRSEDGSAERGGDLGAVGRGMFAPAYEAAAFALKPGELSAVVESDFGFHVIQRIE
ncbi:peptidylprolyl isomerase [Nannocystis bainbridge]|uniref:peptidylprolyl isomerase n=1 Tax=Nannocystis bainbridge TaxID=2995303 RepID=A0ABT5DUZ2_9BACT|nr:peptidylprolyl isomerase [Nannocystis bainbridge]MDC0717381.1 peptidylprolyl isomerase [Nannocystis bainbridge]